MSAAAYVARVQAVLLQLRPRCPWCRRRHHPLEHAYGLSLRKVREHYKSIDRLIIVDRGAQ